jgi:hypothetical protein
MRVHLTLAPVNETPSFYEKYIESSFRTILKEFYENYTE